MAGTCSGTINVCVQNWQCEPGQTGYEIDGCGNTIYGEYWHRSAAVHGRKFNLHCRRSEKRNGKSR